MLPYNTNNKKWRKNIFSKHAGTRQISRDRLDSGTYSTQAPTPASSRRLRQVSRAAQATPPESRAHQHGDQQDDGAKRKRRERPSPGPLSSSSRQRLSVGAGECQRHRYRNFSSLNIGNGEARLNSGGPATRLAAGRWCPDAERQRRSASCVSDG